MDNKFKNVVEVICANPRAAGTFIIPALNKQSKEAIVSSYHKNTHGIWSACAADRRIVTGKQIGRASCRERVSSPV